jgi:hypothetical protein
MDFELERQSRFAELVIDVFDPIFKPFRGKVSHVGKQQLAHKIADNFPLAFGKGMHCAHALVFEQNQCPLCDRQSSPAPFAKKDCYMPSKIRSGANSNVRPLAIFSVLYVPLSLGTAQQSRE